MARAPATAKRPADAAPAAPAVPPAPMYIVAAPLRHDRRHYAPGDPAPAGLTGSQIKRLLQQSVLRRASGSS